MTKPHFCFFTCSISPLGFSEVQAASAITYLIRLVVGLCRFAAASITLSQRRHKKGPKRHGPDPSQNRRSKVVLHIDGNGVYQTPCQFAQIFEENAYRSSICILMARNGASDLSSPAGSPSLLESSHDFGSGKMRHADSRSSMLLNPTILGEWQTGSNPWTRSL